MPRNITVTFDDGSTHVYQNAPDNLTPQQVTARAQKDFGKQVKALDGGRKAAPATQKPGQPSYGLADLLTYKLTGHVSDKAVPLAQAGISALQGQDFGKAYQAAQRQRDIQREQYQQEHPVADWASLPLNLMAGGAKSVGNKFVDLVKAGAQYGGLYGVGEARGTAGEQAKQIAASTLGGAVTTPIVGKIAGAVGSSVAEKMARRRTGLTGPQAKADQIVVQKLTEQGMTPRQAAQKVAEAQSRGVPLTLGDTGEEVRGVVAALSRKPGASRQTVRGMVEPRQLAQGERIQTAIQGELGPTTGVATESQRLAESAAATAKPLYEQAYSAQLPDDDILRNLSQIPAIKQALNEGRQIHGEEAMLANAIGETGPPPLPNSGFDVRTLDYAKRALDRRIEAAYSGDSAAKMQLPNLKAARAALLKRLDEVVPEYGRARAAFRGPMEMTEALQTGQSLVNKSGDEIAAATKDMTPAELDQFRLGFRSALSDLIESRVDGADKVKALIGAPKKRKALEAVFGGKDGLDNFIKTLEAETAAAKTYGAAYTGSPTAANVAEDTGLEGIGGIAAGAGGRALRGQGIVSNTMNTLADVYRYGTGKQGQAVRNALAETLTEQNPAGFVKRAARSAAIKRSGGKGGGAIGRKVGTVVSGRVSANAMSNQ